MPDVPSFSSASRTSSTLFGRTIALTNFIVSLQHALQVGRQRPLGRIRQLGAPGGDVEYVDRLRAFRGNQHQVDVAAVTRDDPGDSMEQPDRVARDDIEN